MTNGASGSRVYVIATLTAALLGCASTAGRAQPVPVLRGEPPSTRADRFEPFRSRLLNFAKTKSAGDQAKLSAIVRRGLDAADLLSPPTEAGLDAISLNDLDVQPTPFD